MWTNKPTVWGALHIISLVLAVILLITGFVLGKKYEDEKYDKKKDRILTIYGFVLVGMEIFKETFVVITSKTYDLTLIPFQLCSTPMYILPFMAFVKNKQIKSAMLGYLAFVGILASFFYFFKPVAMLQADYVILSFSSLLWHESLVLCTAFTMMAYRMVWKENFKTLIAGNILFVGFVLLAIVLNFTLRYIKIESELNLFYISYYNMEYENPFRFPILSLINQTQRPYVIYIIEYIIYFSLGTCLFYGVGFGCNLLLDKLNVNKNNKDL